MDMGWIAFLADSDGRQIGLMTRDATAPVNPNISVFVDDVLAAHGVCQLNGVTGLCCHAALGLERRPSNRMSNALSACFHRWVQRALPRPVGSSAMTAR